MCESGIKRKCTWTLSSVILDLNLARVKVCITWALGKHSSWASLESNYIGFKFTTTATHAYNFSDS